MDQVLTMFVMLLLTGRALELRARHRAAEAFEEALGALPESATRVLPDGRAEGEAYPNQAARTDSGQVISAAGDLAATWGGGAGGPSWIRIWRRPSASDAPGAGWVLAVDLSLPAAPPPDADN